MSIFSDTLRQCLDEAGIAYEAQQIALCEEYYKLVAEANKYMNLTRITDEADAARQHFADAVKVLNFLSLPPGCSVIDVGTGAGFPGIPVKIIRPDIRLTLLDSSGKKTDFIKNSADKLGINVNVICARAEEAAHGALRERFDACFSRAVAPLNILLELCVPFVKTGGMFAAWKGKASNEEIGEARNGLEILGCRVKSTNFIDPGSHHTHRKTKTYAAKIPAQVFQRLNRNRYNLSVNLRTYFAILRILLFFTSYIVINRIYML